MRTLRRYLFGYFLTSVLVLIGLAAIAFTIWKAMPIMDSSASPLSAFWTFIWTEELNFGLGIQFKPIYLIILSALMFVSAAGVLAFSRRWFFLPQETKKLQCPFCRKRWKSTFDRGRMLCPHCQHLINPRIVAD